jgi:proteasome lid subunit RPN8/RPN11
MAVGHVHPEVRTWSAEGHAIQIEYSVDVLEEICADAVDGLYRFRHGGMEIGGVLFGEADGDLIRILAYRPLECEHAFGPRFVLSDRDRAALKDLLYAPRREAALRGLEPVGWYHSHTRSGIELSPRDLEIYDSYFPQRWQIALVVRPDQFGPARGGFFFREHDNAVRPGTSYEEFLTAPRRHKPAREAALEAVPAKDPEPAAEEPPAEETQAAEPGQPPAEPEQTAPAPGLTLLGRTPELPSFASHQPRAKHRWIGVVAAVAFAAAAAVGAGWYYSTGAPPQPLSLWVADMGGQLLIEWDRTASPIRDARSASLEIQDGKALVSMPLTNEQLREGSVDYVRRADIVDVRLRVVLRGRTVEESIRFVGPPVRREPAPEEADLKRQRDELQAENDRLRAQLAQRDSAMRRARPRSTPRPQTTPRKP